MKPGDVSEAIAEVVDELEPEVAELVRERLTIAVRPRPNLRDLDRGVGPEWVAYFYGRPCGAEDEYLIGDDDEVAELVDRAQGTIVVFADQCDSPEEAQEAFLHELAHFLGEDEDDVCAADLGDGDAEIVEAA